MQFDDSCEELSLDVPIPGGVEQDGWKIYPLIAPVVSDAQLHVTIM